MRLSDHFLAAAGTATDIGDFARHMAPTIKRAQCFEIADEVAIATGDLIYSRPSTLVAALPLSRLPYEAMWIEYRGGLGRYQRERAFAPTPWKQGVLVEGMSSQTGFMTITWMHNHREDGPPHQVNISPIGIYFDWRQDGDVRGLVREAHAGIMKIARKVLDPKAAGLVDIYRKHLEEKWMDWATPEMMHIVFAGMHGWELFADDRREHEAVRQLDRHMKFGISIHGIGMIAAQIALLSHNKDLVKQAMLGWEGDSFGEGGWVQVFLTMLNSKNPVVEHEEVDLSKLNKARRKSGKSEFLPYRKTRLAMSRSQANIAKARGVDRETARQHLVRGHFKLRHNRRTGTSGVYWWSPFLRGDPHKQVVERQQYEVVS